MPLQPAHREHGSKLNLGAPLACGRDRALVTSQYPFFGRKRILKDMDPPRQLTMHPSGPARRSGGTTGAADEDELESELLFSVREVGVACFPIPGPEVDEERDG